jgi:LEA14-like dessication related protein
MILRIKFRYILLILLLGIGLSVYLYIRKQKLLNLILPEVTEITLIKVEIARDTAFIEVNAVVENKAPYPMNIDSIVCDLSLGVTKLVSTSQYVGLRQESGEKDTVLFSFDIPISRTREKIMSLQGQDSTGVEIQASIVYSGYKLNLARSKMIEVPVPPKLRILRTERKEFKLLKKTVDVDLFLQLVNEGKNISLDIHDLHYKLTLGNDLKTNGKLGKDVYIRPESALVLKFPLRFNMDRPIEVIRKVWTDHDRVPFYLELYGFIDVEKMKHIPIVLITQGRLEMVNEEKKKAQKRADKKRKRILRRKEKD